MFGKSSNQTEIKMKYNTTCCDMIALIPVRFYYCLVEFTVIQANKMTSFAKLEIIIID